MRKAYLKYQSTLKDVLDKVVVQETSQQLLVDDLLNSLRRHYPISSTTNRSELLAQISRTLGTKLEYRGKGRKV